MKGWTPVDMSTPLRLRKRIGVDLPLSDLRFCLSAEASSRGRRWTCPRLSTPEPSCASTSPWPFIWTNAAPWALARPHLGHHDVPQVDEHSARWRSSRLPALSTALPAALVDPVTVLQPAACNARDSAGALWPAVFGVDALGGHHSPCTAAICRSHER